ncbi:unnamed protein product [Meganyctiphanes norvegica]|uniref:Secreted protein n=1 Tax=Meganyctiphanes norvegica TaxID=48144 RepID=A0AAV2SXM2_MEGNR
MSVCLSPSVCLSLSLCLSVCLSPSLSLSPSLFLSLSIYVYINIYIYRHIYIYIYIYMEIRVAVLFLGQEFYQPPRNRTSRRAVPEGSLRNKIFAFLIAKVSSMVNFTFNGI